MSRRALDVAVVGAGVVGATTALALAQAGLRVALLEAREPVAWTAETDHDLRVFALSPASIRQLGAVGVWDAIRQCRAEPYREMRVWDAAAAGELHFRAAEVGRDALGCIVEQRLIQHCLWQATRSEPAISIRCPARVVALRQHDDTVELECDDGECLRPRLVVAADGSDSSLRALAGIEVQGHGYAQRGIVGYVQTEQPHASTAWQRFLPGGPLALLPCTEGRSSFVWTLPDAEAVRVLELDDVAFASELTAAFDGRLGAMTACSPRAAFPLRMQTATAYVAGRVVLVGDAAHVVHPLAGQGVNLGLLDVAELLRQVVRARDAGADIGSVQPLRRYARVRRSENALAARTFDGINRLFSNDEVLPTLLRGPALGLVDRIAPLKRLLAKHAAG